jgi:NAD(P)-dependent dehydrogenase (short-subunit alcohol dehydrogenase family)
MKTLEGSVAIVAGAASGIGRDIAVALSGEGAQIAIADCKPADDLVREFGQDQAFSGICDGRSPQRVNEFVGEVISRFGTVDILVNSPTWAKHAALADLDDAAIESALIRGPTAALYFMRACYPSSVADG